MGPFKSPTFGMRHIHLSLFQEQFLTALHHFIWGWKFIIQHTNLLLPKLYNFKRISGKIRAISLQKVNKNANVSWGLDGWGRWPRNLGCSISKSFFSLHTLWVITESFCWKLFNINSLAWDQTLMDEVLILKKNMVWVELLLAVTARIAHAKKSLPTLRRRSLFKSSERPMKWAVSM